MSNSCYQFFAIVYNKSKSCYQYFASLYNKSKSCYQYFASLYNKSISCYQLFAILYNKSISCYQFFAILCNKSISCYLYFAFLYEKSKSPFQYYEELHSDNKEDSHFVPSGSRFSATASAEIPSALFNNPEATAYLAPSDIVDDDLADGSDTLRASLSYFKGKELASKIWETKKNHTVESNGGYIPGGTL